jgi:tetratricopeptide (TPR) repeat protein
MRRTALLGAAVIFIAAPVAAQTGQDVPLYHNLGTLHHRISTSVPLAQRYFDQGFRLTFGFNHAEAIAAYRHAAALDTSCAMCWWGVAWAFGPNINAAMDSASGVAAYQAIGEALKRLAGASPRERAYIHAMAERFGPNPLAHRGARDSAYARAMDRVADAYPDDPDAQVLDAEALMLLAPWNYWTADGTPRPGTPELLRRLTGVIQRDSTHPGACHYYIHAVEAAHPERAIPCAERLPTLMPGAGHIVHMPAHVYVRVGRYVDAITANEHAIHADEQYIADRRPEGLYPLAYYPHNYHFLAFAAQMAGQSGTALAAARAVASKVDLVAMRQPGLETLQHFYVTPYRVMVRFGRWDEMLAEPAPPSDLAYAAGVYHWARGLALVRRGDVPGARAELALLERAAADSAVTKLLIWNINSAAAILRIADHMLAGEIAGAAGDGNRAVAELREAVGLEDALTYDEPPTWELPARHYLGAALLAKDEPGEAERAYRNDLKRFPENGWSLWGLAEALQVQGKGAAAAAVRTRFQTAWRTADVTLTASRY